jgi:hypothetical protein
MYLLKRHGNSYGGGDGYATGNSKGNGYGGGESEGEGDGMDNNYGDGFGGGGVMGRKDDPDLLDVIHLMYLAVVQPRCIY